MEKEKSFLDEFEEKEKTSTLKTLTILTFIGSGLALIGAVWALLYSESGYQKMQEVIDSGKVDQMPSFFKGMYTPERMEIMRKTVENVIPLFIINFLSGVACIFGAIKMRKLKADGYWIWLVGELLPYLGLIFFVGIGAVASISYYIGFAIIALFIILYTLQRKNLS